MPPAKLGMWLFLASDALTFAALLFAYAYARNAATDWPAPFRMWPSVAGASLMTACLLASSWTMVRAVQAAHAGPAAGAGPVRWLWATAAGGAAFLGLHANEWRMLVGEGMRVGANPWGNPMFGGTFFVLTGLHMLHVLIGIVILLAMARRWSGRRTQAAGIEIAGLYWHFVDLVWMFLFPLVYLLSVAHGGGH